MMVREAYGNESGKICFSKFYNNYLLDRLHFVATIFYASMVPHTSFLGGFIVISFVLEISYSRNKANKVCYQINLALGSK